MGMRDYKMYEFRVKKEYTNYHRDVWGDATGKVTQEQIDKLVCCVAQSKEIAEASVKKKEYYQQYENFSIELENEYDAPLLVLIPDY